MFPVQELQRELVVQYVRKRISHNPTFEKVAAEQDWPSNFDPHHWKQELEGLDADFGQLLTEVGQVEDFRMLEKIPGTETIPFELSLGILQYNIYHAVQISLIRRMKDGGTRCRA